MKYMVMAALLMAGVATYAQKPAREQGLRTPVERLTPEQKAEKLSTKLSLTAEQQEKVKVAYEEQDKASADLKEKYKGEKDPAARKAMVQEVKANRDQFNEKMKTILTEEQFKQWQEKGKAMPFKSFTSEQNKTLQAEPKTAAPKTKE